MDLDARFPAIDDLRSAAKRRLPYFIWEYLDGATGTEAARWRAEAAFDRVEMVPAILTGRVEPDLGTELLGRRWSLPFGVAPVGMSGAVWPDAERHLARLAAASGIPYSLSTVAAATPEDVAGDIGGSGWFQLYPAADEHMRRDILARVRKAGFHTLVLTVDAPVLGRREREKRVRLKNPMRLTLPVVAQSAMRPVWAMGMLGRPIPRPTIFDPYIERADTPAGDKHIGLSLRCVPDWAYLETLRAEWDGPLVVKGVLDAVETQRLIDAGTDAIWVSSHGGRQFEAAPAPLEALTEIRAAAGPDYPLIVDGGIRSGTDILRALALGADFVMLGRAFHYGLGAAGAAGAAQVVHVLSDGLRTDMAQLGIARPGDAHRALRQPPGG